MCGIAGMAGPGWESGQLARMVAAQTHRGPDDTGTYVSADGTVGLGHNRLSIIDLSPAGHQPMSNRDGSLWILLNGEVYNVVELRATLKDYPYRSLTDTETVLAAYERWGERCLDHFIGMFSFAIWDERARRLFCARDRFGVKPFFFHEPPAGGIWFASEIKALHAAGVPRRPDESTWATYLTTGMYDHDERTFWEGIRKLLPGQYLTWSPDTGTRVETWYDLADAVLTQSCDSIGEEAVAEQLLNLLEKSVALRFRADVEVGVCLSGGLDSSLLLGLVLRSQGSATKTKTFTFCFGDPKYDETPWVEQMLEGTSCGAHFCKVSVEEVPELAARVQAYQDEPFGGLPTLGMAKVHERARAEGVTVLLDGNGMDEAWGGYEYYSQAESVEVSLGPVQGSRGNSIRPDCLTDDVKERARSLVYSPRFDDPLRNLQYRDIKYAKIPRALRFGDRTSMMFARELREPFLDHRVVELGLRQPVRYKIRNGQGKWLVRQIAAGLLPAGVREAQKRAVQTPQREWLRGPLAGWADDCIGAAVSGWGGGWLNEGKVRSAWEEYRRGGADNSFPVWQWISLGLMSAR